MLGDKSEMTNLNSVERPFENFEVLFVDDDRRILSVVEEYLSCQGYRVTVDDSGPKAFESVKNKDFDVVFTDLKMPGLSGLELLSAIKEQHSETEVVVVTGYGTVESAVDALKLGSYDYLQKPIKLEQLKKLIDGIMEKKKLQEENISLKKRLKERYRHDDLVGVSLKMQQIYEIVDKIRLNSPTVLIQGESGTGKEVLAKIIHQSSDRRDKPFIPVNCGAIPEGLLESELFGHLKGSFTGAIRDAVGLFEAAEGGTIFLDEVVEVAPSLQVKLLRVLQERTIRPVGDTREIEVDGRVIAATNRDLDEAMRTGVLRRDFFYRLNVISIEMPPLRERKDDIPLLVNYFLNKFNARSKKQVLGIVPEAMDILLDCDWPGNVRQLENVIERAFALGDGETIGLEDLPSEITKSGETPKTNGDHLTLKENETILIGKALAETGGSKAEAATLLGIDVSTLYRKLKNG